MSEEKDKTDDTSEQDRNCQPRPIQEFVQGPAVCLYHALDEIAGPFFHSGFFVAGSPFTQNARAHQGRECQRNETGRENSDDDGNRKFLKDSAKQSWQENQRNKYRGQRKSHRQNGERNFPGGVVSRFQNRFAVLGAANHVFQKDDRVVDQKSDGQSERHQSEVVNGEAEHVHHGKGEQQRKRQGDSRNQRVGGAAEKNVDHHHHEHERDHQGRPHVVHRIHDCLRTIEYREEGNRSRQTRAQLGKKSFHGIRNFDSIRARLPRNSEDNGGSGRPFESAHPEKAGRALILHTLFYFG